MGYSKKLPMCPMKKLFMFFQFLLVQNCYANEYFCEFTKKVDSISFVESSEIENSLSEENEEVLKLISEPLLLKINKTDKYLNKNFVKIECKIKLFI